MEGLRVALESDRRIAYALVFGSRVRGTDHAQSDVDVAIGFIAGQRLDALQIGELIATIEAAVGRPTDVILLDDAPPGLAYRVFRDGSVVMVRDETALKARLARAVLEYLDFRPVEDAFARSVLAARDGR